jgi:hypothetical protein
MRPPTSCIPHESKLLFQSYPSGRDVSVSHWHSAHLVCGLIALLSTKLHAYPSFDFAERVKQAHERKRIEKSDSFALTSTSARDMKSAERSEQIEKIHLMMLNQTRANLSNRGFR